MMIKRFLRYSYRNNTYQAYFTLFFEFNSYCNEGYEIGVDIVEINRIEKPAKERFINRFLHQEIRRGKTRNYHAHLVENMRLKKRW